MANKPKVIYLCDRKQCGDECTYPECKHTTKMEHAVNFEMLETGIWVEKEKENGKN